MSETSSDGVVMMDIVMLYGPIVKPDTMAKKKEVVAVALSPLLAARHLTCCFLLLRGVMEDMRSEHWN